MKITSILAALLLFIAVPVFANDGGACAAKGKGDFAQKRIERMKEKLALSDAQADQIKGIFEAKKQKMEALKTEIDAEVNAVLTPEQKEKHEAMKKEFAEKHKNGNWNKKKHQSSESQES